VSNWKLTATITHKSWNGPVIKELPYAGETLDDVLAQIETLPQHIENLRMHRRTAFKDANGVKHAWKLQEMKQEASSQNSDQKVWPSEDPKDPKISTLSKWRSWLKSSTPSPSKS